MTVSINSILGHSAQNSYVSVTNADAYFALHTEYDAWAQGTSDTKPRALITASRRIDGLKLRGSMLFPGGPTTLGDALSYGPESMTPISGKQGLQWPIYEQGFVTGTADSATATTLVDASLILPNQFQDDYWIGGSIRITDGTDQWDHREITDFVAATGTLTVAGWTATPDTTSTYILIPPLPWDFTAAVCEQALLELQGVTTQRAIRIAQGAISVSGGGYSESYSTPQGARSKPDVISPLARIHIDPYLCKSGKVVR